MQGINDSIQSNNKQINRYLEEIIGELEPSQKEVSIFDETNKISDFAQDEDKLSGFTIGAGVTAIAAAKYGMFLNKMPDDKLQKVNEAIDEVFNNRTNLSQKGCKIKNLTSMDAPELKETPKLLRFLDPDRRVVKGKNAGFYQYLNEIHVNREKMALATFHEMGHAYNFNNVKALKKIQKARPFLMAASIGAVFLPVFIKEKYGQDLSAGEKAKNNIRSVAPFISGACFLPIAIEEGIASLRASKFAKPLLEKGVYKRMCKVNACGFATYLLSLVGLMAIAQSNKVRYE